MKGTLEEASKIKKRDGVVCDMKGNMTKLADDAVMICLVFAYIFGRDAYA